MVGWHNTSRHLPNFELRTTINPSAQSTSSRSRRIASPIRIPVTANNPTSVSKVADLNGGVSLWAAPISAAISVSEYR